MSKEKSSGKTPGQKPVGSSVLLDRVQINLNEVILEEENGVCGLVARKGTDAERTLVNALNIRCPLPSLEEARELQQRAESHTARLRERQLYGGKP